MDQHRYMFSLTTTSLQHLQTTFPLVVVWAVAMVSGLSCWPADLNMLWRRLLPPQVILISSRWKNQRTSSAELLRSRKRTKNGSDRAAEGGRGWIHPLSGAVGGICVTGGGGSAPPAEDRHRLLRECSSSFRDETRFCLSAQPRSPSQNPGLYLTIGAHLWILWWGIDLQPPSRKWKFEMGISERICEDGPLRSLNYFWKNWGFECWP